MRLARSVLSFKEPYQCISGDGPCRKDARSKYGIGQSEPIITYFFSGCISSLGLRCRLSLKCRACSFTDVLREVSERNTRANRSGSSTYLEGGEQNSRPKPSLSWFVRAQ